MFRKRGQKRAHTGWTGWGFFESFSSYQPPEGKGVRLPLDKLRNSTPVFLGIAGTAEFLHWHIPWALEPRELAKAGTGCGERGSISQHRPQPPCICVQSPQCTPEGVKNCRSVGREGRGETPRTKEKDGVTFWETRLLFSVSIPEPPVSPVSFSDAYTFCVSVLKFPECLAFISRRTCFP